MNNNEQQPKLTDEEVWLRAYCASISTNSKGSDRINAANSCLKDFKEKFRQNERT